MCEKEPKGLHDITEADLESVGIKLPVSESAGFYGYAFISLVDCPSCGQVLVVTNSHRQRGDKGKYVMCQNHDCAAHLKLWKRPMVELIGA